MELREKEIERKILAKSIVGRNGERGAQPWANTQPRYPQRVGQLINGAVFEYWHSEQSDLHGC